jgi:hypothetical protein
VVLYKGEQLPSGSISFTPGEHPSDNVRARHQLVFFMNKQNIGRSISHNSIFKQHIFTDMFCLFNMNVLYLKCLSSLKFLSLFEKLKHVARFG